MNILIDGGDIMKKVIKLALIVVMAVLVSVAASAYTKVYIDGGEVPFNDSTGYPFVDNGRTLVPLRVTMETFGAEVDWEQSSSTAFVRFGTTTVRCSIGDSFIYRNNVKVMNDAAAVVSGGRTYLPIRAVLEAFGATVGWNDATKSVTVDSGSGAGFINQVKYGKSVTTNYWGKWTNALNYKAQGNYQLAIDTILSISNVFITKNDSSSIAMLFKHLGECYANLYDFGKASACFKEEAKYWASSPGMEQSVIDANRRAKLVGTNAQVYVKNYDKSMGAANYFGVEHEPVSGILLGSYAEGDWMLHTWDGSKHFMNTFPSLVESDMAAFLLYLSYGQDISNYQSVLNMAKKKNIILQISLQPHDGMGVVKENDPYLKSLAKNMEKSGCRLMLRFAGEMNDETSTWYESDPNVFIEKFRIVADIFHEYAPSVPVVWSPNFYPEESISKYYPGDEYVDYVGISSYKEYTGITDPFGQGIDRSRWSNQLDMLYSLYGHKKPIVISEGNVSSVDYYTGEWKIDFACSQLTDFYTYLPIKYPNIKMNFIFASDDLPRRFALSNNPTFLDAYKKAIKSESYLENLNEESVSYDYYEIGNNVSVKAESTELCSYITTPYNDVAYVSYTIDGVHLGTSYAAPYNVPCDFTWYKGKTVTVGVTSYNAQNMKLTDTVIKIKVV